MTTSTTRQLPSAPTSDPMPPSGAGIFLVVSQSINHMTTTAAPSDYAKFMAEKQEIQDLKAARTRCWGAWLKCLGLGVFGSVWQSVVTDNWRHWDRNCRCCPLLALSPVDMGTTLMFALPSLLQRCSHLKPKHSAIGSSSCLLNKPMLRWLPKAFIDNSHVPLRGLGFLVFFTPLI